MGIRCGPFGVSVCDMTKDWDIGDYPFDMHILNIVIGPYADALILPPLELDTAHSGANADAVSKGWRLQEFPSGSEDPHLRD